MPSLKLGALLAAAYLGSYVLANPTSSSSTSTTSTYYPEATYCKKGQKLNRNAYDINFDNIPTIPATARNPIPDPYDLLYFQSFFVVNTINPGVLPGPLPHSPKNYIVSDATSQIQNGQPLVSVIYQNTNTTAFDLFSFYYACVASTPEGATGVNAQCDVTVTGYQGSTNTVAGAYQVCAHTFTYAPPTAVATTQQAYSGLISDCRNLQFATFSYFGTGANSGLTCTTALLLDDLLVAEYSCT